MGGAPAMFVGPPAVVCADWVDGVWCFSKYDGGLTVQPLLVVSMHVQGRVRLPCGAFD